MTHETRLTDAARAAIEAAVPSGPTEGKQVYAGNGSILEQRNASYQRGWDDCYAAVVKALEGMYSSASR